jgi:hypothetical protein
MTLSAAWAALLALLAAFSRAETLELRESNCYAIY